MKMIIEYEEILHKTKEIEVDDKFQLVTNQDNYYREDNFDKLQNELVELCEEAVGYCAWKNDIYPLRVYPVDESISDEYTYEWDWL